jgi:hypothetical protein
MGYSINLKSVVMKTELKKVFIEKKAWSKVETFLRTNDILWDGDGHFQFDMKTFIISFLGGVLITVIIGSLI